MLNFRRRPGVRAFKAYTDTLLDDLMEPSIIILQDTLLGKSQRALFWRGQIKATPYAGYDDFAQNGELSVHVRIVLPLNAKTPVQWTRSFSDDCERLLRSVRLAGRPAFPSLVGYPSASPFGRPSAARPNER